ncbi:NACHT, LRR and PYD domains-containing protein 3-like [Hypanus sabinus]|uniref:NACHT, LRR and PYD domains-containing protein 3-like n=1 Tax=Hypanus sabinus TaxID=79690 RepID=UPI0028C482A6|nr:NACHT, LRR and PYD domains-containing protein 3-like [Hypanus sabinus]
MGTLISDLLKAICLFVFRLAGNELGDSGVKLVSVALSNPECKIQRLGLDNIDLTVSGAENLASALKTNRSLMDLYMGHNKLGDSGVKQVFVALRNPECKIQKLGLRDNSLTDSGVEDLVAALSTNPSLTELDLSENKLGDSGVKLVSAALRNPECKIQKLLLYNVGLRDSGAEDLAFALITNSSQTGAGPGIKLAHRQICPGSPPRHTDPPESGADRAALESVQSNRREGTEISAGTQTRTES